MLRCVLLVAVVGLVLCGKPTVDFSCSKPTDILQGEKVTIVPDDIKSNENITVTASGKLSANVASGDIHVHVSADGIPVLSKQYDLCTELAKINKKCPLVAGSDSESIQVSIPGIPVHGAIAVAATVVTKDDPPKEVVCVKVKVAI